MLFAEKSKVQDHALVILNITEILILAVDLNAHKIMIATIQKLASIRSVEIHVLEYVETMLNALL